MKVCSMSGKVDEQIKQNKAKRREYVEKVPKKMEVRNARMQLLVLDVHDSPHQPDQTCVADREGDPLR